MISLRKRMAHSTSTRMLLPALAFLACASVSAAGGGVIAALCLVPAGLVLDATRGEERTGPDGDIKDA